MAIYLLSHSLRVCLLAGCLSYASADDSDPYDYHDIVSQYCHTAMDWGPLPQRPGKGMDLLQVQVFIRHGARTQCAVSPSCWDGENAEGSFTCKLRYLDSSVNDDGREPLNPFVRTVYMPGRNEISGNCMTGQLVEDGFDQHKNNGQRLREAYIDREHLLPPTLANMDQETLDRKLFFRSTDVPRTRQSGMALLSGLFGRDHHVPPFPKLQTMDFAKENMLVNSKVCSAVDDAEESFFKALDKKASFQKLCKALGLVSDSSKTCYSALTHRVDCLMSRICPTVPFHPKNTTIPPEYLANDAALLRSLWKEIDEAQFSYFKALSRVGIGPFISEVVSAADSALAAGKASHPFMLFSGHDTGPMEPLYAAFDLRSQGPYWPTFASMLVLEVWNSSTGPMTRWISNGKVVGDGLRPYKEFKDRATLLIPSDAECQRSVPLPVLGEWDLHLPLQESVLQDGIGKHLTWFHLALSALGGSIFTLLAMAGGSFILRRKQKQYVKQIALVEPR